jgi:hypothetical protein
VCTDRDAVGGGRGGLAAPAVQPLTYTHGSLHTKHLHARLQRTADVCMWVVMCRAVGFVYKSPSTGGAYCALAVSFSLERGGRGGGGGGGLEAPAG